MCTRQEDAIRLLLDERKVEFDAVVAANDRMAPGALRALKDRGIRVPDHDELPTVMADATQLTRLLQNLIGNAIKFRQVGTQPEIHVGAKHTQAARRKLRSDFILVPQVLLLDNIELLHA